MGTKRGEASGRAMLEFFDAESEMLGVLVSEYRSGAHAAQPWKTVSADRLVRIWSDAARYGFVRDTKGLDRIERIFVENTVRLAVNTYIAQHTPIDPSGDLAEYFEPDEVEAFVEWAIETPDGWRISDCALEPLRDLAALLTETPGQDQKLVVLDRMLNVVHQRSDIASWYVEGGIRTLNRLADGERPTDERPCLDVGLGLMG